MYSSFLVYRAESDDRDDTRLYGWEGCWALEETGESS